MSEGRGTVLGAGLAPSWASVSPSARTLLLPLAAKMGRENLAANPTAREVQSTKTTTAQLAGRLQETFL